MTKNLKKEFLQLTPEELKELVKLLNKKYAINGRSIGSVIGLSKSRVYQLLKG